MNAISQGTVGALNDTAGTADHGGDDSAADLALLTFFAYATHGDPIRMERLFGRSALARRDPCPHPPHTAGVWRRLLMSSNPFVGS